MNYQIITVNQISKIFFNLNKCIRNNQMEITIDTTSNKTSLSNAIQQFFD
jgi:Tfp pilus assembly ATPase PilU